MKLKNKDLIALQGVYNKICALEFEFEKEETSVEVILAIAEDFVKIEDSFKAYAKLEGLIKDKAEKQRDDAGNLDIKVIEKAHKEMNALADAEVEVNFTFTPIPFDIIKKIKLKPLEVKILKEFNLF